MLIILVSLTVQSITNPDKIEWAFCQSVGVLLSLVVHCIKNANRIEYDEILCFVYIGLSLSRWKHVISGSLAIFTHNWISDTIPPLVCMLTNMGFFCLLLKAHFVAKRIIPTLVLKDLWEKYAKNPLYLSFLSIWTSYSDSSLCLSFILRFCLWGFGLLMV